MRFVRADLAEGLSLRADLIVSNPPYVPAKSAPALIPDVRNYEPAMALFGGVEGLEIIDRLLTQAAARLAPGGTLIVEFGYGQEDDVRASAAREGWLVRGVLDDLQGIARTAVLGRPVPDCLFCKIVAGDIPASIVHRDEHFVAFKDINPQAPLHVLDHSAPAYRLAQRPRP